MKRVLCQEQSECLGVFAYCGKWLLPPSILSVCLSGNWIFSTDYSNI